MPMDRPVRTLYRSRHASLVKMGMMAQKTFSDGYRFSVTLNGSPLDDVLWADEETGQAEVYEHAWSLEQRGQRVPDSDSVTGYRTFIVRGDIRIIDDQPPAQPPLPIMDPWSGWMPS